MKSRRGGDRGGGGGGDEEEAAEYMAANGFPQEPRSSPQPAAMFLPVAVRGNREGEPRAAALGRRGVPPPFLEMLKVATAPSRLHWETRSRLSQSITRQNRILARHVTRPSTLGSDST